MRNYVIRFLGSVLCVFGFVRTVFGASICPEGSAIESTFRARVNYTVSDAADQYWYVGWLNSNYTGSNIAWEYDLGKMADGVEFGSGGIFSVPSATFLFTNWSSSVMKKHCILPWDMENWLPAVQTTQFQPGCASEAGNPGALYALGTGLFAEMGCCVSRGVSIDSESGSIGGTGASGYDPTSCPCFFTGAVENQVYTYRYYGLDYVTKSIDVKQVCYNFVRCNAGWYQESGNGSSWYPAEGVGFCVLLQPGTEGERNPCYISGAFSSSVKYCSSAACAETGRSNLGRVWPGYCLACPGIESANVVSGYTYYTPKYSVGDTEFGVSSCKMASYTVTDSRGTLEFSCDSTYK